MSEQDYICKKCNEPIADIAKAMVDGCGCGSRLFKKDQNFEVQSTSEKRVLKQDQSLQPDENIAIHVKGKGVYELNLENLTKRESTSDPIFVQDSKGKINVIFNPDA